MWDDLRGLWKFAKRIMGCLEEGPKARERSDLGVPGRNQHGKMEGGLVKGLIKCKQVAGQYALQAMHLITAACPVCSLNSWLFSE